MVPSHITDKIIDLLPMLFSPHLNTDGLLLHRKYMSCSGDLIRV